MDNTNNNKMQLNLVQFTEEANMIVNRAVHMALDEKCAEINTVHLFLSILADEGLGDIILDELETSFDEIYETYRVQAKLGRYGVLDESKKINPFTLLSKDLLQVLTAAATSCVQMGYSVSVDSLIDTMLDSNNDKLVDYLDSIGTCYEDIIEIRSNVLGVPVELYSIVESVNAKLMEKPMKISNMDGYTDEMIEVLSRKTKSNPCLLGEAGVGKTTAVYGLAQRIIEGKVPKSLMKTHIIYVNSSMLLAGTRYRGEFEERMSILLDWASQNDIILFLDEIHTFINCGKNGEDSANTAGNMIKKHLSDGSIRVIGTTTYAEYHKFIEVDKAFDRRLQPIHIKEPSVDEAIDLINNTISEYAQYHNVLIASKAIELAVKLSDRYIKDKFLPDKAYMILDQASAKVKIEAERSGVETDRSKMAPDERVGAVEEEDVLEVVSKITKINVNRLGNKEAKQLLNLENTLSKRLIGQEQAVKTVSKAIRRAKSGVREQNKPLASFMFVGPTGVGKTELCKVLSEEVSIGETPLIKIDMSEYSEKSSVSKLIGSAPGYVGYGEGGQLTEKVKHNPYCLLLFDEIEKAHPEIFNTFLQLLDEGKLTDGQGSTVDFTKCIIVMTSNAGYGAEGMNKKALGFSTSDKDSAEDAKEKEKKAMKALEETFKPEFLNRLDNIVIFEKLSKEQCKNVAKLLLNKLKDRVAEQEIELKLNKSIIDKVVNDGYSEKYGARNLRREIQDTVEDAIADSILSGTLHKGCTASVSWKNNKVFLTVKETNTEE